MSKIWIEKKRNIRRPSTYYIMREKDGYPWCESVSFTKLGALLSFKKLKRRLKNENYFQPEIIKIENI